MPLNKASPYGVVSILMYDGFVFVQSPVNSRFVAASSSPRQLEPWKFERAASQRVSIIWQENLSTRKKKKI